MAKTLDELTAEINAAVHTNQAGRGKTTAPGLNAVLQSLAYELTTGGAGPAAPAASFATLLGQPADNAALAALLADQPAASFATLLGQPADNAALAALLAAQPAPTQPALALEFVFEAGFADSVGRALGPRQAGTYASEQRQNVADVSYQLNGAPAALPLTVAAGDVLQVALTRQDAARPAVLTLFS